MNPAHPLANTPTEGLVRPPHRRRWRLAAAGVALMVVASSVIAAAIWFAGGSRSDIAGTESDNASPTSLATVTRRSLSSQTRLKGTLGYAGNYSVVNQASGTITALPTVGEIVIQGQRLYEVDGSPVVVLYGSTPIYRALSEGVTGRDVAQLNANLAALGYATTGLASSDTFSARTASALKKLQAALGVDQTGSLALGQAIFLPAAARVTAVVATLGAPASPGTLLLRATSTTRQVNVALDAARQSQVEVGDQVTIELPDGTTTPGVVSAVGTVATVPSLSGGPGDASVAPTIPVDITLTDPTAAGSVDQAPVPVLITTASVTDALVVPVTALLAVTEVGYAVEVVEADGTHQLVPVALGLFDEANGLVQVSGSGLAEGQQVVVPGR